MALDLRSLAIVCRGRCRVRDGDLVVTRGDLIGLVSAIAPGKHVNLKVSQYIGDNVMLQNLAIGGLRGEANSK